MTSELATRKWYSPKIQRVLLSIAVFTCSFEIFLVLNLGFNFKLCQLATLTAGLLFVIEWAAGRSSLRLPKYFGLLGFALLLSVIYWPNSDFPIRSVGYSLWFAFDVLAVVLFFNLYDTYSAFVRLICIVLLSVCMNSWFGIVQFLLGITGIDPPLVTQWWIEGVLPRINGFNYEPSFYATYLGMGWILSLYLWEKGAPGLNRPLIILTASSSSVAMLLCSSRMGWFAMALWIARPFAQALFKILTSGRLSVGRIQLLSAYVVTFGALIGSVLANFSLDQISILTGGLGVTDESGSYSADERSATTMETGLIAVDHLVFGVGLGGVSSEMAKHSGARLVTLEDAKNYEGKNITFELIASLGLLGAGAVYGFIGLTIARALALSRRLSFPREALREECRLLSVCLRGLCWALIVEFVLLQFNQNVLRAYTWTFIGILLAAVRVANSYRARATTLMHHATPSMADVAL